MKITYIHHSAFLAELEKVSLLFDYAGGMMPEINTDKPLIVFASHRHEDHFKKEIFELEKTNPDIHFILSNDIWRKRVPESAASKTTFAGPDEALELNTGDGVLVKTLKSTDEGVAFMVFTEGKSIYHAGDLNNWYWEEEPDTWNTGVDRRYREELSKMAGYSFDTAFVPLDTRQGEWFYLGMHQFMEAVGADTVFPMHFWKDYSVIERIKSLPAASGYKDKIIDIHEEGEKFDIN